MIQSARKEVKQVKRKREKSKSYEYGYGKQRKKKNKDVDHKQDDLLDCKIEGSQKKSMQINAS